MEDSSRVVGWRSSGATQQVANPNREGEIELEKLVQERHSNRMIRVDQSRNQDYFMQSEMLD